MNCLSVQLFMFERYMNKTVVYATKLAIMNVQLGGCCSKTWHFTMKLYVCKPVYFSATFGIAVIWTHRLVFADVSKDSKESGRKEGNKEKRAWKADYYKTVIEKTGCLSEKEKWWPGLGNNEQNFKSSYGSSCSSDFLHSNALWTF